MALSPIDDVVLATVLRQSLAPTTSCIKVDGCALDLITSVFNNAAKEFMHSKRVPFFLSKVRNYSSHVIDNAAPSPSSFDNVASPTQAAPSPSLVDNVASPTSAAPSPSPVADVVSPLHMAPSWTPAPAPTTSCIKVGGSALNFITSVFKRKISLSTLCCQMLVYIRKRRRQASVWWLWIAMVTCFKPLVLQFNMLGKPSLLKQLQFVWRWRMLEKWDGQRCKSYQVQKM
ncbi:hypothetical protein H5410_047556 [Solanum commersonii]|uniref:Uncharacterized protein n=1 Tax=Solanum commersonii TaxID=4109 RepID=A0A9J5XHF6_SOLCO|nr:hypothetical protein H5410_047556 [Solanum commersonii]